MPARVGVVTVLFNSDEVLHGFFQSLAAQKGVSFRLYVIDNSKSDSGSRLSRELADLHGIDCEILFNDANLGVAKGNNQGIDRALRDHCSHVLLANNDIEFEDPKLLSGMLEFLARNGFDVVVPKIFYYGQGRRLWFAGGTFSRLQVTTRHRGDWELDHGQHDAAVSTEYAPTCFMLLKSEVFARVGLMREPYFVYYDDTDFVYRLNASGTPIGYMPAAEVLHKVSHSTGGDLGEFSLFYFFRNRILFLRYNYSLFFAALSAAYVTSAALYKIVFSYAGGRRRAILRGLLAGWKERLT